LFKLTDLQLVRRSWVKVAGIPRARMGYLLRDCIAITPDDMDTIKSWLKLVKAGLVIRAVGKKSCGLGMLIYGKPGIGKTTLSLAIIQELLTKLPLEAFAPTENKILLKPCYFATFNDVLDIKGRNMGDEVTEEDILLWDGILGECKDDSYNIRVLVVDDLGKEHASLSGWQKNQLHHVLRTRFNNGLPTIVTTNIARDDWDGLYGDATASFAKEAFVYLPIDPARGDLR
jgi:Cdc6-like AAA superfamily ATPase